MNSVREKYNTVLSRIKTSQIRSIRTAAGLSDPVFFIFDGYPGIWLEHVADAVFWARYDSSQVSVAIAQIDLFLQFQKEDGQLPCYIIDLNHPVSSGYVHRSGAVGFGHVQEVVSVAALALETAVISRDEAFLLRAYNGLSGWDEWLARYRNTLGTGLVEMFCEYDTGHDNSPRVQDGGIPKKTGNHDARVCPNLAFMPLLAPDMSAHVYASRIALADMAGHLGKSREAERWKQKAEEIKERIFRYCFDAGDEFFYDVDRRGQFRKYRSEHITRLFHSKVLDQPLADRIYARYLRNPEEFWTPYPFPSMSMSDPAFDKDYRHPNSWACWSNGLTALRAFLWMDHYGKGEDLNLLLRSWVNACCRNQEDRFSQGIHPVTGNSIPGIGSWYSSTMLLFLHAVNRLGLLEE
jgi:hypothetical protein